MKRRQIGSTGYIVLVSVATFAMVLVSGLVLAQEKKEIFKLKFATPFAKTSVISEVDQWFCQELEKRTGGQVKIEIGWGGAFGRQPEYREMLAAGVIDFGVYAPGFDPQRFPIWGALLNSPTFLFDGITEAAKVARALPAEFPSLSEELHAQGVAFAYTHHLPPYVLMGRREAKTFADLQGAKVRSYGEMIPRCLKAGGMVPVTVMPAEWYESVQRGVVDYMFLLTDLMVSYKIHEVSKYLVTATMGSAIGPHVWVSLKTYNRLPKNIQNLIQEVGSEAQAMDEKAQFGADKKALITCKDAGVKIVVIPSEDLRNWKNSSPDIITEWLAEAKEKSVGSNAEKIAVRLRNLIGDFNVDTSLYETLR